MREEVSSSWNEALHAIRKAEQHLKAGEDEKAQEEAWRAVLFGQDAIKGLLTAQELKRQGIFIHIMGTHEHAISSQDHVNAAKRVLGRFINLSPPENRLWGENELE